MTIKTLPQPVFIEVKNLGQIGAGRVVKFTPRDKKRWVSLPKGARTFDQFDEFEVCGDSLNGIGIYDGNVLLCRKNFELSEIKPHKVCILLFTKTNEMAAKMVALNMDGTVTVSSANPKFPSRTYFADEIEILALAIEVKRQI